jgi:hypothetical protein
MAISLVPEARKAELEEAGMHLRDLWARHPEVAGGNVHHVHAVSFCVPLSRRQAARNRVAATCFATHLKRQRPPS